MAQYEIFRTQYIQKSQPIIGVRRRTIYKHLYTITLLYILEFYVGWYTADTHDAFTNNSKQGLYIGELFNLEFGILHYITGWMFSILRNYINTSSVCWCINFKGKNNTDCILPVKS